ncbi:reverse transcriptase domain-containing protein [Tanacetum coccineum]|uniref:Reverse transcriptase domain-containing protein n=1 Tax=Tanacetum coccineum TaxID=301880 RepID=A0ABQ4WRG5_9ASTR
MRMPNNVKTYDGTGDPEDHVKKFQAAAQYVKDPVEIHNIKQRDGETLKDFMERFKVETGCMKGAPECMRISRFMHGGKLSPLPKRKARRYGNRRISPNGMFPSRNLISELKKQIEELVRAGKLSHLIKEIKQGRDQTKNGKKEALAKDKSFAIYMIQPWHRMTRQKVTQSFARVNEITSPPLTTSKGKEGPLVIEAEIGGHMIHRMYVDRGSSTKAPGDNRRHRSFYKSMDEFHDHEVTITIQWHHRMTWNKRDPSVFLHPNFPNQEVAIRGTLSEKGRTELCSLLKENLDIFAWQPSDMIGVPRSISEHRLNIRKGYNLVRQKKRGQAPERAKAILAEVQKLVEPEIMREVYYHNWLSNPVMVKKHDGSWRMCVDFTDLNKACPQDCYHQIQMAVSDEEKMAFHTSQGVYCYTKMPFGLKNVGATYERLVDKAFNSQVGQNVEVYVDDLVIKSYTETEMLRDVDEKFRTLQKIYMKLNPKKCTFGAVEGMFLGYMISPEGIKPCPEKTEAVLQLPSPWTIKEKYIKKSDFYWTPEVEQAFKQLKHHLSELPLLVVPKQKEELIVYLSASYRAVSAVLMTERGTF